MRGYINSINKGEKANKLVEDSDSRRKNGWGGNGFNLSSKKNNGSLVSIDEQS